ncbi:MAG TPA: DUF6152 family protein [Vicinamibacterales bacterium]|nr:DUF6152 family protein [Vicinamibacterales bacterium]
MKRLLFVVVAAAALFLPKAALAHHGWGGNLDEEFELSGTVTRPVSLAGPHATMMIKDAQGHEWTLTLAPPPRTSAAGVKDGMFAVGTKVSAHGHRNRDMKKYEMKTERITVDGKTYNVYPDRT